MRHLLFAAVVAASWSAAHATSQAQDLPKLIRALESDKKPVRFQAAQAIGNLGTGARSAAPALWALIEKEPDPQVTLQAMHAFTQIGAHTELRALLQHPAQDMRQQAAWGLAVIGPPAKKAVPDLIRLLKEDHPLVQCLAATALAEIGLDNEVDARDLIRLSAVLQPEVRQHAILALSNLGPKSIPALEKVLHDEEQMSVRLASLQVLANQGREARHVVPTLTRLLKDRDENVRALSAGTLAAIGGDAKDALPDLLESLLDKNVQVQSVAFHAAVAVGQDNRRGLMDGLRSANARGRWATPFALGQHAKVKEAVPGLIKNLKDKDIGTRVAAALTLGQIGRDAEPAIPALTAMLKDANTQVRASAQQALAQLDQKNREEYLRQIQVQHAKFLKDAQNQQAQLRAGQARILQETRVQMQKLQGKQDRLGLEMQLGQNTFMGQQLRLLNERERLMGKNIVPSNLKLSYAQQNQTQQAHIMQLVQMHLYFGHRTWTNTITLDKTKLLRDPTEDWVRDQLIEMDSEAVPAFVQGLNLASIYNIGFV